MIDLRLLLGFFLQSWNSFLAIIFTLSCKRSRLAVHNFTLKEFVNTIREIIIGSS